MDGIIIKSDLEEELSQLIKKNRGSKSKSKRKLVHELEDLLARPRLIITETIDTVETVNSSEVTGVVYTEWGLLHPEWVRKHGGGEVDVWVPGAPYGPTEYAAKGLQRQVGGEVVCRTRTVHPDIVSPWRKPSTKRRKVT